MIVQLKDLRDNPLRDFIVDPIDGPENDNPKTGYVSAVTRLKESIEEDGFWGGVVIRETPNEPGTYQIACGHHRIKAAELAGYTEADLVVLHLNDDDMVRIYGRENATQRGQSSTAMAGTVAAALRKVMLDQGLTGEITNQDEHGGNRHGIGRPAILEKIGMIPGVTDNSVKEQLATLKDSGDYRRIVHAVAEELQAERERIEAEAEEARLEAEKAARVAERARKAADKAKAEAKAKADAEARAKAREAEKQAKLKEQRQREQEEVQRRLQAEADKREKAEAKVEKTVTQADDPKFDKKFDYQGVAKWLHNDNQVRAFRKWATGPGIAPYLPVNAQAALAKALVEHAVEHGREVSSAWINQKASELLANARTTVNKQQRAKVEAQSRQDKVLHWMGQFSRSCRGMLAAGTELAALQKQWPKNTPFPITGEFRTAVAEAKKVIDQLHKEIK